MNKKSGRDDSLLVWDCWEDFARNHPDREAIVHWDALSEPFRWTYDQLLRLALKTADNLKCQGVAEGDVCGMTMRHNKYFYPIYMGLVSLGAIPAVLAYPNPRLHPDKFWHGISGIAQKSGLDWIITERELDPLIRPLIVNTQSSIKNILFPLEWMDVGPSGGPEDKITKKNLHAKDSSAPFLLQHSSGTTGLQKAVLLSHRAVVEHVKRYSQVIQLSPKDKVVNWLPLYHDMGLIAAFHMPLIFGIPSIHIDPFQWVSMPAILFQAISQEKATLTWLPNFAYNFMADKIRAGDMEDIDLSSMRMFVNCSEVVRFESHEKFYGRFREHGVKKEHLAACYAMAETTFAVTQTAPGLSAPLFSADRAALAGKKVQPATNKESGRVCVSSGKPIPGCALKIVDEKNKSLPEDRVGRIVVKSVSLFDGYRNDPRKTKQVLKGGWYFSGDLGFCHQGEYFIIGREDDVIIVAGQNIFPEDIEDEVSKVPGVIPGRVVAFGMENPEKGTQDVCVIAETALDVKEQNGAVTLTIKQAGMNINVSISEVYLVPARWLIKSSAGKPSRKINKERILAAPGIRGCPR